MDVVLSFRSLIEGLGDSEFNLFLSKLFEEFDKRTLVTKSLFNLLLNQIKQNNTNHSLKINRIIKNIIELRKTNVKPNMNPINKSNNNNNNNKIINKSFNNLASTMITLIGTFLDFESLLSYKICNRHVAISCHKMSSTLQYLTDFNWLNNYILNYGYQSKQYQIARINTFKMIKEIKFVEKQLTLNLSKKYWKFNNLNALGIANISFDRFQKSWFADQLKNIQINKLEISGVFDIEQVQYQQLIDLLCCNKQIQCLSLKNISIISSYVNGLNFSKFKNLKNLKCIIVSRQTFEFYDRIINILSDQLQSIHIYGRSRHTNTLSYTNHNGYPKLIELCVYNMDETTISGLIKNATNLKRIEWGIRWNTLQDNIINVFSRLLNEYLLLEYFSIVTNAEIEFLWKPILKSLQSTKIKKNNFKLYIKSISMRSINNTTINFIKDNISNLVEILDQITSNDFILILYFAIWHPDLNEIALPSSLSSKFFMDTQAYGKSKKIIIGNKGNMMNGYSERWMYYR